MGHGEETGAVHQDQAHAQEQALAVRHRARAVPEEMVRLQFKDHGEHPK